MAATPRGSPEISIEMSVSPAASEPASVTRRSRSMGAGAVAAAGDRDSSEGQTSNMPATPRGSPEISIEISPASVTRRSRSTGTGSAAVSDTEGHPNILLRCSSLSEWAGNACSSLSFLWATIVLLGGFCALLQQWDFWYTAAIMLMEGFRLFSQDHRLPNHPLFGTAGAIRKLAPHSVLKDERAGFFAVLAVVTVCEKMIFLCPTGFRGIVLIVMAASGGCIGNLPPSVYTRMQRHMWFFFSALSGILLVLSAQWIHNLWTGGNFYFRATPFAVLLVQTIVILSMVLVQICAILLLVVKPPAVTELLSMPVWNIVLCSLKVVLGLGLMVGLVSPLVPSHAWFTYDTVVKGFLTLVLALSTLQNPHKEISYYWVDVGLSISTAIAWMVSFEPVTVTPGVLLMIAVSGNLQLPTTMARVSISSLRLQSQQLEIAYPNPGSQNLVPALHIFYWLVICQGVMYLCACILGFFGNGLQSQNQTYLEDVQHQESIVCLQTTLAGRSAVSTGSAEEFQSNANT